MKIDKIHNQGQARLFKNDFLELLTKSHPMMIFGMYIPVICYFLYSAEVNYYYSPGRILYTFLAGVFFWTFFEYMLHRFFLHWISDSVWMKKVTYTLHGNHHHFPRDKQRLFMPPVPSLIFSVTIFGIMYLIMGTNSLMFFPGFLMGYLIYGSMHYAIHAWNPPFKWMKPLWRNHHLHHYKNDNFGFGVSSTLWDHVFGTMFDLKK
jgi:sterol desaturase/sphingolipid hydroxylase (fatty acid hydroxylase superfamily)